MPRPRKDYTGQVFETTRGGKAIVLNMIDGTSCTIKFLDGGHVRDVQVGNLTRGQVTNPLVKSICNVGFTGVGVWQPTINSVKTAEYMLWKAMIERCYSGNYPSYANVSVVSRWHNFQSFCEDLPSILGYKLWVNSFEYELDKDTFGGTLYSKDTCVFLTNRENLKAPRKTYAQRAKSI